MLILRGLPGSGKTTLAETITSKENICTADDFLYNEKGEYVWTQPRVIRAHRLCEEKALKLAEANTPFIVIANVNMNGDAMRPYNKIAREFGYNVFSTIVENRHGGKNSHGVDKQIMKKMRAEFSVVL